MIIVGYQGIGKSTLAGVHSGCIDLESGNFWVNGVRPDDWYKYYVNIAIHLSNQGFVVFTSSHKVVRDEIEKRGVPAAIIYPSMYCEGDWVKKLEERYNKSKLDKDYKAWKNAETMFVDSIMELEKSDYFIRMPIMNPNHYDLRTLVSEVLSRESESHSVVCNKLLQQ